MESRFWKRSVEMERLGTPDRKGILAYLKPMSPEDVQKKREQEAKDKEVTWSTWQVVGI